MRGGMPISFIRFTRFLEFISSFAPSRRAGVLALRGSYEWHRNMRAEKLSGCDPPLLSSIPILIIIEQLTLRLVCTHGWVVCLSSKTQRAPIKESDKEEERICDDNDEAIQCLPPSYTDGGGGGEFLLSSLDSNNVQRPRWRRVTLNADGFPF